MKRKANKSLQVITAVFLLAALIETAGLHSTLPLSSGLSDFVVRTHARELKPDPDIVIVDIDDSSLARMQDKAGAWPWPRVVHGEMVRGIAREHPAAIVFDLLFSEDDRYRPDSDAAFNDALAHTDTKVYFPMVRRDPVLDASGPAIAKVAPLLGLLRTPQADEQARISILPPLVVDPKYWRVGVINFIPDSDGVGRRYPLYSEVHGWLIPSLPARVASDLGYAPPRQSDMVLSWRGTSRSFRHISYADLYEDFGREHPRRPPDELRGKIVIIGTAATGLLDMHRTPLGSEYPGVEMLATALDNLKNHRMMHPAPVWFVPLLTLALLLAFYLLLARRGHVLRTGVVLAAVSVAALGGSYVAVGWLYLLPVLTPLLFAWTYYFAVAVAEYLRERREREATMREFTRFVNPHVAREMVAHGGLSRAGESRQITILFSDIRGFTTLSEKSTPQEIVSILNRYFSQQVDVIFRHGGSLDKFIGDAIMAFWGAPLDDPDHARHAVAAALDMADVLERFRQTLGEGHAGFDIGIGIHSGPAVVGLIGSDQRREYTAIGDTVNLGSRIEGLTKGVSRILVSRDTMALCGDAYDFEPHGSFKVKGREEEVELFAPKRKEKS
jgi:adenylate cyclase